MHDSLCYEKKKKVVLKVNVHGVFVLLRNVYVRVNAHHVFDRRVNFYLSPLLTREANYIYYFRENKNAD